MYQRVCCIVDLISTSSVTQLCPTLCDSMDFTNSQSLLKLMSIESVMLSNHLIFCRCLLFLSSIFPSIRVFSSESELHLRLLFSCSVLSNSLQPHGLQHARLPCPSPSPEPAQIHVHWVSDAVQPFHPLSSPSSPAFNLSQHQGLFQWVSSFASSGQSIGVSASASVLPMNIHDWFLLWWIGWISLHCKGLSRVFSTTTVQKHQFFSSQPSSQSNIHIHTWLLEKHSFD